MLGIRADLRALCVGHLTLDAYETGWKPGGSVLYAAHTWRGLGLEPQLLSVIGDDFPATEWTRIRATTPRVQGRTTAFTNRYPAGHARVQWLDACAPSPKPSLLPASVELDILFLAPVIQELDLDLWLRSKNIRAGLVAIGVQGWVKQPVGEDLGQERPVGLFPWDFAPTSLRGVDVAFLSEEDCAGDPGLAERLAETVPLVVKTFGRRGCQLFQGGAQTWVDALSVEEVDPTGAGDTFAAAFLAALASGRDPVSAAQTGAAAASVVVEGWGSEPLERLGAELPRRLARLVSTTEEPV